MAKDVPFFSFRFPGISGVRCLFTTKPAGNLSAQPLSHEVIANRQNFMRAAGFQEWTESFQVHGDVCLDAVPGAPDRNPEASGDGLFTDVRSRALLIKTADCQALLFADKKGRAVGAIHAGWRGNRMGFPTTAITAFCERYALSPEDVMVVRGPSLGSGVAEFVNFEKEWGENFRPWFNGDTKTMDLWGLTRHQLEVAGVPSAQIYGLDWCTLSHPHLFYSHRRKDTGRQMAAIWIE